MLPHDADRSLRQADATVRGRCLGGMRKTSLCVMRTKSSRGGADGPQSVGKKVSHVFAHGSQGTEVQIYSVLTALHVLH